MATGLAKKLPTLIAAVALVQPPFAESEPIWEWPQGREVAVREAFDPPAQRWLPGHRGVDLAGLDGDQLYAVDEGVVAFSGSIAGIGILSIEHDGGINSTYQPIDASVSKGDHVARGQPIGHLVEGKDHCAIGTCLHLGAKRGDTYLNPIFLLAGYEVALLPMG
ncbi:M23 family metallopeptidase [Ornithinimicrobium sp. Arc0846-15]|nr:M23 family metallopeptidase [Ornithinimicrobium laminariae]